MVKGMYAHLRQIWKKPTRELLESRMVSWRKSDAIVKVEKPLRLDKARALGYKAKKGFVTVRVRLLRGGRKRPRHTHGRKSSKQHRRKTLKMNYRWIAEMRANRKFANLEVLNSYMIGKDGKHYFYEIIMVDSSKPEIRNDRLVNFLYKGSNKKRAMRGLTSAGKKSRGMRGKSPKKKVRPSLRAHGRRGK
jgi:large subunit ribosomal protein L15e